MAPEGKAKILEVGGQKLAEDQDKQFEQTLDYYRREPLPPDQEQLVELLREVQEIYGCIPPDVQQEIGEALKVKATVISSLIRIYPSLKEAGWKHKITICLGPRCVSRQASQVLDETIRLLGSGPGKVSRDGRFYLKVQSCMKNCRSGPNMRIDQDLYPLVKKEDVGEILKKYQI